MRYEIIFSPEGERDYKRLQARIRSEVRDALEIHLRHEPMEASKSRIKRLRVGDVRVFYDVVENSVFILAIVSKADADRWLREVGRRT